MLSLLGGVAERAAIVGRYRTSSTALARAVDEGRVLRVRRGCYALPGADPVRVAKVAWRAEPTCLTAARALGLPVLGHDQRIHLLFGFSRSFSGRNLRPPRSIRGHFTTEPIAGPVAVRDIVDTAAACLIQEHHLVLIDAALNRGLMLMSDVQNLQLTPKRRVEWLIRYADPRCESPLETLLRVAMRSAGLKVESQVAIEGVG
jgi:hypothetical protein